MHLEGKLVRAFECLAIGLKKLISWFKGQNYLNFRVYTIISITCICESWDELWVQKAFFDFGFFRILSCNGGHVIQSMQREILDGMITIEAEIESNKSDSVTIEIWKDHCINQTLLLIVLLLNICVKVSDYLRKLFCRDSLFSISSSSGMWLSLHTIYNNFEKQSYSVIASSK